MPSQILMLRHGITEGNKNHWFYGELDLPLLPEGKEQLREQKARGIYPEIPDNAQYVTTGLTRTRETMEELFGPQDHHEITNLQEMKFGELEAKTFDELKDNPDFTNWTYDESGDVSFPGGESRNEFANRIKTGAVELLEKQREREKEVGPDNAFTVLICHGGVIAAMMHELFPGERGEMWDWTPEPGHGYLVEVGPEGPVSYIVVGGITGMRDLVEEEYLKNE